MLLLYLPHFPSNVPRVEQPWTWMNSYEFDHKKVVPRRNDGCRTAIIFIVGRKIQTEKKQLIQWAVFFSHISHVFFSETQPWHFLEFAQVYDWRICQCLADSACCRTLEASFYGRWLPASLQWCERWFIWNLMIYIYICVWIWIWIWWWWWRRRRRWW